MGTPVIVTTLKIKFTKVSSAREFSYRPNVSFLDFLKGVPQIIFSFI